MTRTPSPLTDAQGPSAKLREKGKSKEKEKPKEGHRETVEAIVVAMILALLVRGFEAEAFVIPTGSMAPTLMGRHKEIACPQCGHVFSVNASEEDEGRGGRFRSGPKIKWIIGGTCVNCRHQTNVSEAPTFNGDRILVMKFPYDVPNLPGSSGPERWDVVVFRYPEEPEVSYIKRLIGLPGEVVRIYFGDVYITPPGGRESRLERKPPRHQDAMQIMVYDDGHRAKALTVSESDRHYRPDWQRWGPKTPGAWTEEKTGTFVVAAPPGQEAELRYRHMVPDPEQWRATLAGEPLPRAPRASLITDFYSYNTNVQEFNPRVSLDEVRDPDSGLIQPHWVGDLTVSAQLQVAAPGGVVRFELIEGGVANRCAIDLTSGVATLSHNERLLGERVSPMKGPGTYNVRFANVDDRLTLVVDGRPVFGDGLTYDDKGRHPAPTAADLAPVGITARGAQVAVSNLVLKRDIYYTQNPGQIDYGPRFPRTAVEMFDVLADSSQFADLGNLSSQEYALGNDRYLMLGDNSPRSKDSRGWSRDDAAWDLADRKAWEVPRALLTGKAFFIYWPHGKPFGPDVRINDDLRVPFRPYVERMRWIR